jgi:hypothetical protein
MCKFCIIIFGAKKSIISIRYNYCVPAAKSARLEYVTQVHQSKGNDIAAQEGFGKSWKDMPGALKVLFRNPVYICNNLAAVCDGMLVSGFATFMTKLLQNQFSLTAGKAATYAGRRSLYLTRNSTHHVLNL